MRVFLGIAVGMVHTVHNGICPRIEKRRSLENEGTEVKCFLPKGVHLKHFVRCVPVLKEGLEKQRQKPVTQEKG